MESCSWCLLRIVVVTFLSTGRAEQVLPILTAASIWAVGLQGDAISMSQSAQYPLKRCIEFINALGIPLKAYKKYKLKHEP